LSFSSFVSFDCAVLFSQDEFQPPGFAPSPTVVPFARQLAVVTDIVKRFPIF